MSSINMRRSYRGCGFDLKMFPRKFCSLAHTLFYHSNFSLVELDLWRIFFFFSIFVNRNCHSWVGKKFRNLEVKVKLHRFYQVYLKLKWRIKTELVFLFIFLQSFIGSKNLGRSIVCGEYTSLKITKEPSELRVNNMNDFSGQLFMSKLILVIFCNL